MNSLPTFWRKSLSLKAKIHNSVQYKKKYLFKIFFIYLWLFTLLSQGLNNLIDWLDLRHSQPAKCGCKKFKWLETCLQRFHDCATLVVECSLEGSIFFLVAQSVFVLHFVYVCMYVCLTRFAFTVWAYLLIGLLSIHASCKVQRILRCVISFLYHQKIF